MFRNLLSYKNLLIVNVIVLIIKLIYTLFFHKEFIGIEDFTIAKNIVKYHQYSEFINQGGTAFKLPVYPYCISFFIWLLGEKSLLGVAVFQALLSFFSPILIYKILKLFSLEKVGVLAGLLYLLSPSYFMYSCNIEATNVFIPILLLWFYLYFRLWFNIDNQTKNYVFLGLISSLLFLTQVVIVPLALLMILALLIFKKINLKSFTILLFTLVLLYSPWVIRNYYVFDQIVLSKTPGWQNIYYGFTPYGQILDDVKLVPMEREHYLYSLKDEVSELEMERIYKNEVLKVTKDKPEVFLKKAVGNFVALWYVPLRYWDDNSLSVLVGRKIYVIAINILTIVSLFFVYRRSKMIFWFSLLFFGNFTMPYIIGHASNVRFKLDFEWYQLILVSYLIIILLYRNVRKNVLKE